MKAKGLWSVHVIHLNHQVLTERTIANLKLKDFRSKNYIFQIQEKDLTVKYSDLNYSVSTKGHATGIFQLILKIYY